MGANSRSLVRGAAMLMAGGDGVLIEEWRSG